MHDSSVIHPKIYIVGVCVIKTTSHSAERTCSGEKTHWSKWCDWGHSYQFVLTKFLFCPAPIPRFWLGAGATSLAERPWGDDRHEFACASAVADSGCQRSLPDRCTGTSRICCRGAEGDLRSRSRRRCWHRPKADRGTTAQGTSGLVPAKCFRLAPRGPSWKNTCCTMDEAWLWLRVLRTLCNRRCAIGRSCCRTETCVKDSRLLSDICSFSEWASRRYTSTVCIVTTPSVATTLYQWKPTAIIFTLSTPVVHWDAMPGACEKSCQEALWRLLLPSRGVIALTCEASTIEK